MSGEDDGQLGEIRITAREIYDAITGIRTRLDVALAGTEATQRQVADHEERIRKVEQNQPANGEDRLRSVERWRYALPAGMFVALASAAAAITAAITK